MLALFYSCVCDYCDGEAQLDEFDRGFIVWRDRPLPAEEFVFPSREDAERWRDANRLQGYPIASVRAPVAFQWRNSTGTIQPLVTADALVTIYPDHRFPPDKNRAFLSAD